MNQTRIKEVLARIQAKLDAEFLGCDNVVVFRAGRDEISWNRDDRITFRVYVGDVKGDDDDKCGTNECLGIWHVDVAVPRTNHTIDCYENTEGRGKTCLPALISSIERVTPAQTTKRRVTCSLHDTKVGMMDQAAKDSKIGIIQRFAELGKRSWTKADFGKCPGEAECTAGCTRTSETLGAGTKFPSFLNPADDVSGYTNIHNRIKHTPLTNSSCLMVQENICAIPGSDCSGATDPAVKKYCPYFDARVECTPIIQRAEQALRQAISEWRLEQVRELLAGGS